jgi:hypothetical protein
VFFHKKAGLMVIRYIFAAVAFGYSAPSKNRRCVLLREIISGRTGERRASQDGKPLTHDASPRDFCLLFSDRPCPHSDLQALSPPKTQIGHNEADVWKQFAVSQEVLRLQPLVPSRSLVWYRGASLAAASNSRDAPPATPAPGAHFPGSGINRGCRVCSTTATDRHKQPAHARQNIEKLVPVFNSTHQPRSSTIAKNPRSMRAIHR